MWDGQIATPQRLNWFSGVQLARFRPQEVGAPEDEAARSSRAGRADLQSRPAIYPPVRRLGWARRLGVDRGRWLGWNPRVAG